MPVKTVFLSSTGRDLAAYREAAYRAIEGLDGWKCVWMENFGARNWQADDFCRAEVAKCDVLVGILGHLHGSCPPGCEQSYTEREYAAAVAAPVPRLMFLAPEDFPLPASLIEPDEKRQKQRAFREQVSTERIRDTFTTPDDLSRRVVAAIRNWEQEAVRQRRPGGARAGGIMPLPPQPYFAHPYPLQEHFTGRATERRMLTQWLKGDDRPVFALVAIGGMGKSALTWAWLQRDVLGLPLPGQPKDEPAVAAACRLPGDARPEGVLWWSFYEREAGCSVFLNEALTYASGGQVDPSKMDSDYDKLRELLALLQQRRLLLVLDGLERELRAYASLSAAYQGDEMPPDMQGDPNSCTDPHAAAFLRQVAALAGGSRVLITSRLFPRELDGLAGCRREELTGLDPQDAVVFFHAQGVRGTRAEIGAACAPYDYLPLALRLLAGVIVRDPRMRGDIRVADRHPVLAELKGKEQHHILEVSYNALDEQEQALLSRIAAFRSPMTYDALSILNEYGSENEFDAALDELIDRGLLFCDHDRYDLHPIVRQHAYGRLTDKEGVHSRLRDYFAAVPAPEKDKVQSLDDLAPVIELYHHTVRAGRYDEAFELFYDRLHEPLYYRFGAYQTCIELLRALFPDGEERPPRLKSESERASTLNDLAAAYTRSGQPRRALPLVEQQIAIREKRGDEENLTIGLVNLADSQIRVGELAAAEVGLRRHIEFWREMGVKEHGAVGRTELGRLLALRGVFTESEQHLATAQEVFDRMGARLTNFVSVVRAYRALRALLMGDAKAALAAAQQARELADEVGRMLFPVERDILQAEWLLGAALVALAPKEKAQQTKNLAKAESHLTEALSHCRGINLVELEPDILLAWARWHRARGNPRHAREHAGEALAIADRCEYRLVQADAHNLLARLALDAGDSGLARRHAEIARERALCDGPPHCYKPALEEAERLLEASRRGRS